MEPGRLQLRREARIEAILDAAMVILSEGGVEALTMPRLAASLDSAVGSLYRYFASKDVILVELQLRSLARFTEVLEQAIAAESAPLRRVRAVAAAWWAFQETEPEAFLLLDGAVAHPTRLLDDARAGEVDAALRVVLGRVALTLAEAAAAGVLAPGDPVRRAYALWAAVHGAAHFRKRDTFAAVTSSDVRREVVGALLSGWGARPGGARRIRFRPVWG